MKKDLFELIKTLSKGERKTFNLFANYYSEGKKNYLRLFELIDSQKEYNEEKIKQKLKEENILTSLPKIKEYLLELIFKSLRFYHAEETIEGKLRGLLADAELCHVKGLMTLRDKAIEKAKHLARVYEKYEVLLTVLNKEFSYGAEQKRTDILLEHEQTTAKAVTLRKYKRLSHIGDLLKKKGLIRDATMKEDWDKIIQDPIMSQTQEPSGYHENLYYHKIWIVYYKQTGQIEKGLYHSISMVKNIESRPDLLVQDKQMYMITVTNLGLVGLSHALGNISEVYEKLIQMQKGELSTIERSTLNRCIAMIYCALLSRHIMEKTFDAGLKLALLAEIFVKSNDIDILYKSILFFNLTDFYMHIGKYKLALNWNNALLNELDKNYSEGLYAQAKIINLIIHFELESDQLLPHLIRSTYRYLHKKKLYKAEDAILRFIRNKLPKANSRKELFEFFKELKFELEVITKDPYEAKILEYFNFISWLESKIQNRPFADVANKRAE